MATASEPVRFPLQIEEFVKPQTRQEESHTLEELVGVRLIDAGGRELYRATRANGGTQKCETLKERLEEGWLGLEAENVEITDQQPRWTLRQFMETDLPVIGGALLGGLVAAGLFVGVEGSSFSLLGVLFVIIWGGFLGGVLGGAVRKLVAQTYLPPRLDQERMCPPYHLAGQMCLEENGQHDLPRVVCRMHIQDKLGQTAPVMERTIYRADPAGEEVARVMEVVREARQIQALLPDAERKPGQGWLTRACKLLPSAGQNT